MLASLPQQGKLVMCLEEHFPPGFFEWDEKDIVEWLSERLAIHEFGGG